MKHAKSDLLQGTLDLLILRTLASSEMHGWGISQRLQQISQDVLQDAADGGGDALPVRGFFRELLAARPGQRVELRAAVVLGVAPRRFDPALLLEPVQRRVERPLIDLEDIL